MIAAVLLSLAVIFLTLCVVLHFYFFSLVCKREKSAADLAAQGRQKEAL